MKPLQLTDTQRSNLIEMCKELFPEFNNINFGHGVHNKFVWFDSSGKNQKEIHWFELCVIELPRRMYKHYIRHSEALLVEGSNLTADFEFEEGSDVLHEYLWKELHPVDVLYKNFKKFNK